MNPGQRGAVAEAAIAFEAMKLQVGVFRPQTESRYDLIFDTGTRLLHVQCKSAARQGDVGHSLWIVPTNP
jgi:PD-(D/E)XK nuclease superfamily protein